MTRRLRTLGIIAFGLALLFPAGLMPIDNPTTTPVATLAADPFMPLTTEEPTFEERENMRARQLLDSEPWHYKCRKYGLQAELMPEDLVPTGNVSAKMQYDSRTDSYETISVDSERITIGYQTVREFYPALRRPVVRDVYSWSYAPGVAHYGTFVLNEEPHGPQWSRVFADYKGKGVYEYDGLVRDRHDKRPVFMIIATDMRSCDAGKPVPSTLWRDITKNGLNRMGADK